MNPENEKVLERLKCGNEMFVQSNRNSGAVYNIETGIVEWI